MLFCECSLMDILYGFCLTLLRDFMNVVNVVLSWIKEYYVVLSWIKEYLDEQMYVSVEWR